VIVRGGGVAYGVKEWMASSNVWSVTTEVSCGDGERWPERARASARSSGLASSNPCEETVGKKGHQVRRSKVR
jgi:hypothetical protein